MAGLSGVRDGMTCAGLRDVTASVCVTHTAPFSFRTARARLLACEKLAP